MLLNEDIHKVDELKTDFTHRWFEVKNILELIDIFNFSSLLGSFSFFKKQGFSFQYVVSALLLLPFLGVSNVNDVSSNCFEAIGCVLSSQEKSINRLTTCLWTVGLLEMSLSMQ